MKTFTLLDRAAILATSPPDWLIEDILPQEAFGLLFGAPEAYKSFVALDAACSVATGKPFLGRFPVKLPCPGDVVYVYGEGGRGFGRRLRAWEAYHGVNAVRLHGIAAPVNMLTNEPERLAEVIRAAAVDPALIVLDTLARCFGHGDENSTQDMNAFVGGCDELRDCFTNCTLMPVHHTGWGDAMGQKRRPRGSRALEGAVDTMLECKRAGQKSEVTLTVRKQKDSEEIKSVECRAVKVPVAGSIIIRALGAPGAKAGSNDDLALRALRDAGAAGLTAGGWMKANPDVNPNTHKDVRGRLRDAGLAEERRRRWYATATHDAKIAA